MHLLYRGKFYNYPQASQSGHQPNAENRQLQETDEVDNHQTRLLPTDRQPAPGNWQSQLSACWLKLASLFQAILASHSIEPLETAPTESSDSSRPEQELNPYFVDRVDPSIYYTVFFPPF